MAIHSNLRNKLRDPANQYLKKLKVGDLVTTTFYPQESHVVRRIIYIENTNDTGSGFAIGVVNVVPKCRCCNRPYQSIDGTIDGSWFQPLPPVTSSRSSWSNRSKPVSKQPTTKTARTATAKASGGVRSTTRTSHARTTRASKKTRKS